MARKQSLSDRLVLGYSTPAALGGEDRRALRAIVFLGCLPLVVAPFLSFTYSTTPASVMSEGLIAIYRREIDQDLMLMNLAAVFFLGIPLVIWHLRLLGSPTVSRFAHGTFRILAAVCVALTLTFLIVSLVDNIQHGNIWNDAEIEMVPWITFLVLAGAWWLARRGLSRNQVTSMCLIGGYLPNAFLCFAGFPSRDHGQYYVMAGCAALLFEWVWILVSARRRRA